MKSEEVVIIGGGLAGLKLARELNNRKRYHVTLVDRVNHHFFQPLFYQVATARLESSSISFPFRKIFQESKNVDFLMTEVRKIVPEEKKVITDDIEIHYDKLIIATGCRTNFYGNDNMKMRTFGMKTTKQAVRIRNRILTTFERMMILKDHAADGDWNIVIVGGGPTGVELAGAFAEMKNEVLPRDYPRMDFSKLKIYLVNGMGSTLAAMSEHAQKKSGAYLKKLGVTVMNSTLVKDYDGKFVMLGDGSTIESTNVIWAAGVTGRILPGLEKAEVIRNRYMVNEFSQIKGYDDVFAIGDVACMETKKYPKGHAQLGSVAMQEGGHLAKNLRRKSSADWKPFEYWDKGTMATVGTYRSVVDLPFWKFSGFFGWLTWMFVHIMLLLGVRNKAAVFFNWAWAFINRDSSLRLIIVSNEYRNTVK